MIHRLARLFNDVFRIQISTGTIKQIVNEAGGALGLFLETVKELLRDAPVVHFDETGLRVEGSLHWVHVASNALYTFLGAHKRRGNVATDEFDIINKMTGVAVQDGFKSYKTYDVVHALCGAHHLRELTSIGEVETQQWANELIDLLIEAKDLVESEIEKGREKLQPKKVRSIKAKYERLIDKGWNANPEPENSKRYGYNKVAANLLKRLDNNRDEVLRFTTNFQVPFDNNQAERDLRMVKLQQKISGSFRTLDGANTFCAIRSYISTMKKNNQNILEGLQMLFRGDVWLPKGTGP